MTSFDAKNQAEALDAYLRGAEQANDPNLPQDEAALVKAIREESRSWKANPAFEIELEEKLRRMHSSMRSRPVNLFSTLLRTLAWGVAALLLVWGLHWALQNLIPRPAGQPAGVLQSTPTLVPTSTPLPTVQEILLSPTMAPNAVRSPLFPELQLVLQADFPASPAEVNLYRQLPEMPITIEEARSLAAQLGIDGTVYNSPGNENPSQQSYVVSDGVSWLYVSSNRRFYYIADYAGNIQRRGEPPSGENAKKTAEEFLQAHSLLNLPYRLEAADNRWAGTIRLRWLLDGLTVHYGMMEAPSVYVEISAENKVKTIEYNRLEVEQLGAYPIISAEEAWQQLLSGEYKAGVEQSTMSYVQTGNPQTWQREFPYDQPTEMHGYLEMLQPAENGKAPWFALNNITLSGNVLGLEEFANSGKVVQANGILRRGGRGQRVFEVQTWQASPQDWFSISGKTLKEGESIYIASDEQKVLLLNPPADLPIGVEADAGGILRDANTPALEWYWINSGYGGGGGGGGGSSYPFRELNLSGDFNALSTPTPTPILAPTPLPGTRLEGESGIVSISIRKFSDGKQETEINWWMEPNPAYPDGLSLRLSGNLEGIEAYQQLPIRLWGSIVDTSIQPYQMKVERYEPTYPGLKGQTYYGTQEEVTIEGKQVILFTDDQGMQYVLKSSIEWGTSSMVGQKGDRLIIEGVTYPGETFGGYPVLRESSARTLSGKETEAVIEQGNSAFDIPVIEEVTPSEGANIAVIENIALVYYTPDLRFGSPAQSNIYYVQPVWRFSGHYQNGIAFEILVQALAEQYLQR